MSRFKHGTLVLLIAIPATAVAMGIVTLYVAFSHPDTLVVDEAAPLSKTSWRQHHDD